MVWEKDLSNDCEQDHGSFSPLSNYLGGGGLYFETVYSILNFFNKHLKKLRVHGVFSNMTIWKLFWENKAAACTHPSKHCDPHLSILSVKVGASTKLL